MDKRFLLLFLLIIAVFASSETLFEKGEKLLLQNKVSEAVVVLEGALQQEPGNEKIYLDLGYAYQNLKQYDRAIKVMQTGLKVATALEDKFYYNIGINYFLLGKFSLAEQMYTESLKANSSNFANYLARANARVKLGSYQEAVADYQFYLQIKPEDSQKSQIQAMIAALKGTISEAATAKLEEANRKKKEEEQQQQLLQQIMNSLSNASDDTKNLQAGSEQIDDHVDEIDIED